jgi:hypothetical protein
MGNCEAYIEMLLYLVSAASTSGSTNSDSGIGTLFGALMFRIRQLTSNHVPVPRSDTDPTILI